MNAETRKYCQGQLVVEMAEHIQLPDAKNQKPWDQYQHWAIYLIACLVIK